ncbi:MAG: polysaccharide deacetylase family protein [Bacilli bacterium]|nr:polysaccharide deacetylase family protein [Bacilli bacterium]
MKDKIFYIKIVSILLIVLSSINISTFSNVLDNVAMFETNSSYVLIEKNVINKSFVSYLYKDNENNYISKIYDYNNLDEIELETLIKSENIDEYNKKIEELLYLKYPKFIVESLLKKDVTSSYLFRENELVIYFDNYVIEPNINEILYLTVNYNEIKDFLDFTFLLDSEYTNESGYDYTNAKKSVAFTFDDSPNENKTNKILSYLKDNHFHATFFVLGNKMSSNKDLLINIKNNGNEIGSHSYDHKNMNKMNDEEFIEDFDKVNNIYKSIFNENIKYIRPPYGLIKDKYLRLIDASYIMWSMDTLDWKKRNSDYIVNYVIDNVKDGDIILFHDSYSSTVKAVEELLPILYSMGYQVMSVSELFELKGVDIKNNEIYYKAT